ncbi:MAG: DUF4832 domain-containing protein [Acidobacteria bacterium]|nr:MAG: DUF4832 domain-containing protein [Acidobacteriota bacterium]
MGITTFQRFNDEPLNEGLKWSEEGPTAVRTANRDKVDFPRTSIAYCRWFWSAIEPDSGAVRWDILDAALEEARKHSQTLAIRLMPYDQKHPLPDWYQKSGARRANQPGDPDGDVWQPDFSDPLYLKYWGRLIGAVGARYDGHPYLDTVDVSSVGYWGEGWSPYMPDFQHQQALIDIYFDAFRQTPLLMNFDQERALAYATAKGAGWRLDCLGDMRTKSDDPYFPPEMLDVYPQQVVRAGIQEVWKRSPVSLETCWVPGHWKEQGWDLDYIVDQALRWHVTSVNIKSSAIPPEWKPQFDNFQKKMGYRFVLRRFEYPKTVRAGEMVSIQSWWLNAGVAPVYREYWLALRFKSNQISRVIKTDARLREWLPGDAVWDGSIYVPHDFRAGVYEIAVGVLDPRLQKPAIRLAIEGRDAEGWYPLGKIEVK